MPKFSIAGLFGLLVIAALATSWWVHQRQLASVRIELDQSLRERSRLRDELGYLDIQDKSRYQIRPFFPRYTRRSFPAGEVPEEEHRWRIYVPDASKCHMFILYGKLPASGVPERGLPFGVQGMGSPDSKGSGLQSPGSLEITLVFMAHKDNEFGGTVELTVDPQFEAGRRSEKTSMMGVPNSAIPWLLGHKCITEQAPFKPDEPFDLDQPVTILKKYRINESGDHEGYMIWLKQLEPPKPN